MNKLFTSLCLFFLIFLLPNNQPVKSKLNFPTTLFVSCESLDFNRWTKDSIPTKSFIVSNLGEGKLKGELKASANWIKLSKTSFEGNSHEIIVTIETTNLPLNLYTGKIEIKTNGGDFDLPVSFDLVEKKVIVQFEIDNVWALVDSKRVELNYPPFVMKNLYFVPLRLICEAFGAKITVDWYPSHVLYIYYKDLTVKLVDGESFMVVNGEKSQIESPFKVWQDTTFIPLNVIKVIFDPEIYYNYNQRLFTLIN